MMIKDILIILLVLSSVEIAFKIYKREFKSPLQIMNLITNLIAIIASVYLILIV